MTYHPQHVRVTTWQVIVTALVISLLAGLYLWSFRAGRERARAAPPLPAATPSAPAAPLVPAPAVPR